MFMTQNFLSLPSAGINSWLDDQTPIKCVFCLMLHPDKKDIMFKKCNIHMQKV